VDGSEIPLHLDTLCIHGDTPGATELTRALAAGLRRAGIASVPVGGAPR